MKAMTSTMTIRIEDDAKDRLGKLAVATRRSRSFLAAEAIREYIQLNEWQIGEIHQALEEAGRGEFAADDVVTEIFATLRSHAD